jgi:hypothetical protein
MFRKARLMLRWYPRLCSQLAVIVVILAALSPASIEAAAPIIERIDGRSIVDVAGPIAVPRLCQLAGAMGLSPGHSGWIYVLTRRIGGQWYIHTPGVLIRDTRTKSHGVRTKNPKDQSKQATVWRTTNLALGRHGPLGVTIEVCSVFVNRPLRGGYISEEWVQNSHARFSELVTVRVGWRQRPFVRILEIGGRQAVPGRTIPAAHEAEVLVEKRNVPAGAILQVIVHPENNERYWTNRVRSVPEALDRWHGMAFLGRRGKQGDIWDSFQRFWIYVVVTRKELPDEPAGIAPGVWSSLQRYILARSEPVMVQRTGGLSVSVRLDFLGGRVVEPQRQGSSGHGPLLVDRVGACTGSVIGPPGTRTEGSRVWLIARKRSGKSASWQVVAGPARVRPDKQWILPVVMLASPQATAMGTSWLYVAVLHDRSLPFRTGEAASDELLSQCTAVSSYVWAKPQDY